MYWTLENVPWTNLHDLNLDWIVNTMKQTVEQWIAYRLEMDGKFADFTEQINNDFDDFTTQINSDFSDFTTQINTWKTLIENEFSDLQTYVQNYFDNLDLNESTRYVINQMIASGEFVEVLNPSIVSATEAWLAEHITPTTPAVDDTLSISGAAADAKATGDKIAELNNEFDSIIEPWNAIKTNQILERTLDRAGTIETQNGFYTVVHIPVTVGETWYAYSIYEHSSAAYNHKVRAVTFYNGNTYVSNLEYVNQWVIPANVTHMNVTLTYITGTTNKSPDDYITNLAPDNHYNHFTNSIRIIDENVPNDFITERMLSDSAKTKYWNAILNNTILENTFIRTNGQQVTSNSFYSVINIPVESGQIWYGFSASLVTIRFVTFYNSAGTAIGGYEYIKSWTIPDNAVTMSVTITYITYTDGTKSPRDYITTILSEIIQEMQTQDKKYGNRETRVCTINFQFDDGNAKDADIFEIFKNNSFPCGFSLLSTIDTNRVPEYLMYQRNGFEILSHSTDNAGMSSASLDPATVNTKLYSSRKILEDYGFNVRGWVTPYSEMNNAFIPLLAKYYDFGTTVSYGEYPGTGTPYQTKNTETTKLFRVSLQLTTLENQKKAVDEAVANSGFLTFYGHSADLDTTDYETTANLNALLSYIKSKTRNLNCIVLKPSDAVDYYFHVRHSDLLALS